MSATLEMFTEAERWYGEEPEYFAAWSPDYDGGPILCTHKHKRPDTAYRCAKACSLPFGKRGAKAGFYNEGFRPVAVRFGEIEPLTLQEWGQTNAPPEMLREWWRPSR